MLPPALRRPFIPPWLDVVVVGVPRSKQIFIPRCFFAFVAGSEMALLFWHLEIAKWLDGRIRPSLANILLLLGCSSYSCCLPDLIVDLTQFFSGCKCPHLF